MKLSIQIDFDKILDLRILKETVVIGRSSTADLVVDHHVISRQHCQIEHIDGKYYITDLGSLNGVYVNNERIPPHEKVPLKLTAPLALGTLECQISDSDSLEGKIDPTIIKTTIADSGNYTSTLRLARLDIDRQTIRPNKNIILEEKTVKRPRNPVTAQGHKKEKPRFSTRQIAVILFMALLVCGWLLKD